ncbi:glycosyltransferase [Deferribacter thermophilus]|uniref:glycosyltransferase n=1 Tax=Deferribacter thermophilus TaxID=53573 RepID=UPI003C2676B9
MIGLILQENLSNAIMESLACATPVVAFDVGGNCDMIEHKQNGYLAKPFDTDDLAYGIDWVLNYQNYDELCKNAREKVLREFDSKVVAKKYIELYEKVISD